jgi:hypothetical protein
MSATLTINDLAASEALDREAMTAICGGFGTLGFMPRNLINQELNAITLVGTDSIFLGGNTELNVSNRYTQSANQVEDGGGSKLGALMQSLGQLGKLGLN